jgi:predicted phage tail component-like protein
MAVKGFTFNSEHSSDKGVYFKTRAIPYIAPKRSETVEVQGRDGGYVFEDGYSNIIIELQCVVVNGRVINRRKAAREIAYWLSAVGTLNFDNELDINYEVVKITHDIAAAMEGSTDQFTITFECKPYQENTYYNDGLTWAEIDSAWSYFELPWGGGGTDRVFTVTGADSLVLNNYGTYKALPVIKLVGTASSITIGSFTITNLSSDTVYVDCLNQIVYEISGGNKVNWIDEFSGDFLEIDPGENTFAVSGTITSVEITFDYKNTYL